MTIRTTGGFFRRVQAALWRHRVVQLLLLLVPPVGWFGVVYLGSLAILLLSAFWYLDPATSAVRHDFSLQNLQLIASGPVYRDIAVRTILVAAIVTVVDILIAFPIAYYMARIASSRVRALIFVLVLLPLWAGYLVKIYAWKIILAQGGLLEWFLGLFGQAGLNPGQSDGGMVIAFCYLWLPYMILPIYTGLERIPASVLEASSDLGGRGWMTFRRVVLPLALPAVAAGSIFTFSLTLGDYVTPQLIANTKFIGNVVFDNQGVANNVPFAAAYALVPIAIMAIYLLGARRLGAFESL
jgi:putative spermidine/putrescine transport system permease protein